MKPELLKLEDFRKNMLLKLGLKGPASKIRGSKTMGNSHPSDHILHPNYHPLGRLPEWFRAGNSSSVKNNIKANNFLSYQEKRIKRAIVSKQYRRAILI